MEECAMKLPQKVKIFNSISDSPKGSKNSEGDLSSDKHKSADAILKGDDSEIGTNSKHMKVIQLTKMLADKIRSSSLEEALSCPSKSKKGKARSMTKSEKLSKLDETMDNLYQNVQFEKVLKL
jgi:phage/plasmid primase-like uncharacterized protein